MKINYEKIVKSWGKDIPNDAVERVMNKAKSGLEFIKSRGIVILKDRPIDNASLEFSDNEGIILYYNPGSSSRSTFGGTPNECRFESIGFQLEQIFGNCEMQSRQFNGFKEGPIPLVLGKEHRRSLTVLGVIARENDISIIDQRIETERMR
jgi:hypothetical protein